MSPSGAEGGFVSWADSLWDKDWIDLLAPPLIGLDVFLSSDSLAETITVQTSSACHIYLCIVQWHLGTRETSVNTQLTLSAVLWIIKSFVSDPVVLCLLPASMKLFVYMEGKLSGQSHFLAYPRLPFIQVRLKYYVSTSLADWWSFWISPHNPVRNWCSLCPRIFQTKLVAETNLKEETGIWHIQAYKQIADVPQMFPNETIWNKAARQNGPLQSWEGRLAI